jgi:hypothetical protein
MRVIFKHEDEANGEPIGPVYVIGNDVEPFEPRPFDPDREPDPWVTLSQAQAIADEHNTDLEEV